MPHPEMSDPTTTQAGILKRFLREPPVPVKRGHISLEGLKMFARRWVKRLTPLSSETDLTFETWLQDTSYPEWRKADLRRKWENCGGILKKKHFLVKSFVKDEFYPEFKHARVINSRSDEFKCAFGPWIKAIENIVYQCPEFIKHIPVRDRPAYIESRLRMIGAKYFWADFTAFESHFTPEILKEIEFILYEHMASKHPRWREFKKMLNVIAGSNHCVFKYFTLDCKGRRMSGEMNTSLGNGFVNLMLISYLFECYGEEISTVVEGDDSNTRFVKNHPTVEDFAKLGFTVKCGVVENMEEMSFCGLVYDLNDKINVPDPYRALASFAWARSAYWRDRPNRLKTLLRVKALSYAHQYPGAPVVSAMAQAALFYTRSHDAAAFVEKDRHMGQWDRERFKSFPKQVPIVETPMSTRLLCERVYGMTVEEQLNIEASFKRSGSLGLFDVDVSFPSQWKDYYDRYATRIYGTNGAERPYFPRNIHKEFKFEFPPLFCDNRTK